MKNNLHLDIEEKECIQCKKEAEIFTIPPGGLEKIYWCSFTCRNKYYELQRNSHTSDETV